MFPPKLPLFAVLLTDTVIYLSEKCDGFDNGRLYFLYLVLLSDTDHGIWKLNAPLSLIILFSHIFSWVLSLDASTQHMQCNGRMLFRIASPSFVANGDCSECGALEVKWSQDANCQFFCRAIFLANLSCVSPRREGNGQTIYTILKFSQLHQCVPVCLFSTLYSTGRSLPFFPRKRLYFAILNIFVKATSNVISMTWSYLASGRSCWNTQELKRSLCSKDRTFIGTLQVTAKTEFN
uniref:Uncharacterized protein n=1 Tax=Bubo bubo TaxID=30461 RepID=A0A8C0EG61_BUBBB